jgi:hypothetical protein
MWAGSLKWRKLKLTKKEAKFIFDQTDTLHGEIFKLHQGSLVEATFKLVNGEELSLKIPADLGPLFMHFYSKRSHLEIKGKATYQLEGLQLKLLDFIPHTYLVLKDENLEGWLSAFQEAFKDLSKEQLDQIGYWANNDN